MCKLSDSEHGNVHIYILYPVRQDLLLLTLAEVAVQETSILTQAKSCMEVKQALGLLFTEPDCPRDQV